MARRVLGAPDYIQVAEMFPREGPWSNSNNLGTVKLSEDTGVNYTLLKQDEWWMPHTWSLSLWSKPRVGIPDNSNVTSTRAKVNFGVGGATQSVEVDFVRGTVLTLVANSIEVQVTRASKFSQIYAQLALGPRGPCGCPKRQLFQELIVLAGATSAGFTIPDFTSELIVVGGSVGNVLDPLVFVKLSGQSTFVSVIQSTPLSVLTANYGGKLPITTDAVSMQIVNASANDIRLNCFAELGL